MYPALQKTYRHQRAIGWRAQQALRNAKIIERWNELGGAITREGELYLDEPGTVRLVIHAADMPYDDSYLDTWGLSERALERERQQLWNRIESEGVWGMVAEFWDGDEWQHADSCWGFIGEDWHASGYDVDLMSEALDSYDSYLAAQAQTLEASRPDMNDA